MNDTIEDKAIRIIMEIGRGSVSVLQRRLNITYNKASAIIDRLIEEGVLKKRQGCQSCEISNT